jgi:hypothetical protein
VRKRGRLPLPVLLTAVTLAVSGCSWQTYAVSRGLRYATGVQTRFHTLRPLTSSLKDYRVIEVRKLDDMLPGHVPPALERYLNARLVKELGTVPTSPRVVSLDDSAAPGEGDAQSAPAHQTLVCEGFIDDYDPGYLALRLVELGFNHLALTVRLQLRDKATGRLVGAASVTSQDDRVSATSRAAADRLAHRLGRFVGAGYGE